MLLLPGTVANAANTQRLALKLDESLKSADLISTYYPEQILITQIESPNQAITKDSERWYQQLYYYFVTRLGFADIPYTYLIDRDGTVYEGLTGGDFSQPFLENSTGGVLIGYMSNGSDLTSGASVSFKSLIEDLSTQFGLDRKYVKIVDLEIVEDGNDATPSQLAYTDSSSTFAKQFNPILNLYSYSTTPAFEYSGKVSQTEYKVDLKAGESSSVMVEIQNTSDMPWFTNQFGFYLETADGKNSPFAPADTWESLRNPLILEEPTDGIVNPDETISVSFDVEAPLLKGEYADSFLLRILDGPVVKGTEFEVTLNVAKGDFDLVQVTEIEGGYTALVVREHNWINSKEIGQAEIGGIYITTEYSDGWYKIKLSDTKSGWVYGKYIRRVSQ